MDRQMSNEHPCSACGQRGLHVCPADKPETFGRTSADYIRELTIANGQLHAEVREQRELAQSLALRIAKALDTGTGAQSPSDALEAVCKALEGDA